MKTNTHHQVAFFTRMLIVLIPVFVLITFSGCDKDPDEKKKDKSQFLEPYGVFVINEGQFMSGNGDISFYDKKSKSVQNNLFFSINNRPPGDIPQSLSFYKEEIWLVVNNSNTIEVVGLNDFSSVGTIEDLAMPRQMILHGNYGYVSQLGSGDIARIDLAARKVIGSLPGEKSTDHLLIAGGRLFAANWTSFYIDKPNNTVMVYDLSSGSFVDSVMVAKEPNSMVLDADGRVWVLSSGGFMGEEFPALTCFDPNTLQVIRTFEFPDKAMNPALLTVSPDGRTLYFVNDDVFAMGVDDQVLPQSPFISSGGSFIYGMASDPENGDIYLTDPIDFQQDGRVFRYSDSGLPIDTFRVGINPAGVYFYQP